MRNVLKTLIVVAAAAAAGPALANDSSDSIQSQALIASQLAFAAQASSNMPAQVVTAPALKADMAAKAAISQGFAPVDTASNALHGAN